MSGRRRCGSTTWSPGRPGNRWDAPEPFTPGWVHAVTISIPVSSIQPRPYPLGRLRAGETVSFFVPGDRTHTVRFDVLIKSAGAPGLRTPGVSAQVGRIALHDGGCVWVFASEAFAVDNRADVEPDHLRQVARESIVGQMGSAEFLALDKHSAAHPRRRRLRPKACVLRHRSAAPSCPAAAASRWPPGRRAHRNGRVSGCSTARAAIRPEPGWPLSSRSARVRCRPTAARS
jgi:hypothetical protein